MDSDAESLGQAYIETPGLRYLTDPASGRTLACSQDLSELCGADSPQPAIDDLLERRGGGLCLRCADGVARPVRLRRRVFVSGARELTACELHVMEQDPEVEQLRAEVDRERRSAREVALSSVRLFRLTERIRRVPDLAAHLMLVRTEAELFLRAADLLCSRDEMDYAGACFYLVGPDRKLRLVHAVGESVPAERLTLPHGEERLADDHGGWVVPLRGREHVQGYVRVALHPRDAALLAEGDTARREQERVLADLAVLIGLLVDNLRLVDRLTGRIQRQEAVERMIEHQLRGRLTYLKLLPFKLRAQAQRGEAPEEEDVGLLEDQVAELMEAIDSLEFINDESNRTVVLPEVDVLPLLDRFVQRARERFPQVAVELVPPTGVVSHAVHPGALREVLRNLLNNAVDSGAGRVWLKLAHREGADNGFRIHVQDDGSEFLSEAIQSIRERRRYTSRTGDRLHGTGMVLVYRVLDRLGGRLDVHPATEGADGRKEIVLEFVTQYPRRAGT